MSLVKTKDSMRSLFFAGAVLGLTTAGLWFGAQFNVTEAGTSSVAAPAATFAADAASLGAIPDRGVTGCADANPATSKDVTFTVSGLSGSVSNVEVSNLVFGAQRHTWVGDVKAILIAPNGASHVLFGRTGATTSISCGNAADVVGPYEFADNNAAPPSGGWWQASTATTLASGEYRTTALGGAGATNPAPATSMNPSFTGVANANGTWTLRFTDHGAADTGAVQSATLSVDTAPPPTTGKKNVDFNGDGKSDFVVARGTNTPLTEATSTGVLTPNRGKNSRFETRAEARENQKIAESSENALAPPITWYISSDGVGSTQISTFGDAATDFLVPNDYDGDGKTDIAIWRPGAPFTAAFYILNSSNQTVRTDIFGQTDDDPAITGDYDGDGKADTATFRCPAFGAGDGQCYFYYRPSNPLANPQGIYVVPWGYGETGDFFVNTGDFDGDGKNDFCLQRANPTSPQNGQFVLLKSNGFGVEYINWGTSSDFILPGDYDGDGSSDFCVRRTVSGARQHYILERDGGGTGASPIVWGITGDISVPGDYDGDGKQDVAVWRGNTDPNQNFFYVRRSSDNAVQAFEWGQCPTVSTCDFPAASWYVH